MIIAFVAIRGLEFCVKSFLLSILAFTCSSWSQSAYEESISGDLSAISNAPTLVTSSQTTITVAFTTDREGLDRDILPPSKSPPGSNCLALFWMITTRTIQKILDLSASHRDRFWTRIPFCPPPRVCLGGTSPMNSMSTFVGDGTSDDVRVGYDEPLPSGFYTFWAQETSDSNDEWVLSVVLSPVDVTCEADVNGNARAISLT